jgi:hypothetical protein
MDLTYSSKIQAALSQNSIYSPKLEVPGSGKNIILINFISLDYCYFNPPSRKASADAKERHNSSVLGPFFETRACSGIHAI